VNTSAVSAVKDTGLTGNDRAIVEVMIKTLFCSPLTLSSCLYGAYHQVLRDRAEHIRNLRQGDTGWTGNDGAIIEAMIKTLFCSPLPPSSCLDGAYHQVLRDRGEQIHSLRQGDMGWTGKDGSIVEVMIITLFCSPLPLSSCLYGANHQVLRDRGEHIRNLRQRDMG
jgi:hypothetical protein